MFSHDLPLDPVQANVLTHATLAKFREDDFDLAERVIGVLAEIPPFHPVLSDGHVSQFVQLVENAGAFLAKLPAVTIREGQVIHRDAAPDLAEAQVTAAETAASLLSIVRIAAGRLEEAGFKVYGREIGG